MSGIDGILAGYKSLRAGQEAFYKDLNQHPELSHAEHRTARRVAGQLQDAGFTTASDAGTNDSRPVGRSRPAIMFSSVDLPLPEGPIIAIDSPASIPW
jgi:metal-dependent amidase/aminoacylase/carboxypeptidase family protein